MNIQKQVAALVATASIFSLGTAVANGPVWDGNKVEMVSEQLADGVFAYYSSDAKALEKQGRPVATSGGFIVGEKGVLLVDTLLNERLNNQVQTLIKQEAGKPIVYAVNTSAHGDHSYGNMYLPEDTTIIQHSNTKAFIDGNFEKDKKFMIQGLGKGRGIEEIKPVSADTLVDQGAKITVDLGNKAVDIIDFGFAQTGGDLFVWEPQSKVMWTGNAVVAVKPALPWLLDGNLVEALETLKKVYAFLPADARVVPGHGSVIGREDIKWHIDYLSTVKTQVQAAIDDGLTLQQTVQQVRMPEFGGYGLFGWVHPKLNVPAAYKDLTQEN